MRDSLFEEPKCVLAEVKLVHDFIEARLNLRSKHVVGRADRSVAKNLFSRGWRTRRWLTLSALCMARDSDSCIGGNILLSLFYALLTTLIFRQSPNTGLVSHENIRANLSRRCTM